MRNHPWPKCIVAGLILTAAVLPTQLLAQGETGDPPSGKGGDSHPEEAVPFDSDRWEVAAREWRVEEHLGRSSLYLKGGLAWLRDVELTDGVIEFDVVFSRERGFMGGIWRLADPRNYEEFYLRPHQSGNPDANQYTPVFHGLAGWQLYHGEGYGAPVEYAFDTWQHVKIVFSGSRGEVFIDSDEPVVVIDELKHAVRAGKIGVEASDFAPAHFSNFRYRKLGQPALMQPPRTPEPAPLGTIRAWAVSTAFDGRRLEGKMRLAAEDKEGLDWTALPAESTGITNLARVQGVAEGSDTAFARVRVTSDREQTGKLRFGYSDRVRVYLNDRLLYSGDNTYRSRDYRYLGTIGLFDEVYVPLREGSNEIWFAVSESFGGWGLLARFENLDGIRLVTP